MLLYYAQYVLLVPNLITPKSCYPIKWLARRRAHYSQFNPLVVCGTQKQAIPRDPKAGNPYLFTCQDLRRLALLVWSDQVTSDEQTCEYDLLLHLEGIHAGESIDLSSLWRASTQGNSCIGVLYSMSQYHHHQVIYLVLIALVFFTLSYHAMSSSSLLLGSHLYTKFSCHINHQVTCLVHISLVGNHAYISRVQCHHAHSHASYVQTSSPQCYNIKEACKNSEVAT